jgi:hypothetical protein
MQIAGELDKVSQGFFAEMRDKQLPAVQKAVDLARCIRILRQLMSRPIMEELFMPLMNSALGFLTDKGTERSKDRTPYAVEVVRDCLIDALLSGFKPTGNEFNIIAGRAMGVLNGWRRLCEELPGLTDLDVRPGTVQMKEGRAFVRMAASWKLAEVRGQLLDGEGKPGIVFEIPTSGGFSGPDALVGKATRRTYKAIYQKLTGTTFTLPDADTEENAGTPAAPTAPPSERVNLRNGPAAPQAEPVAAPEQEQPEPQTLQEALADQGQGGISPEEQAQYAREERIQAFADRLNSDTATVLTLMSLGADMRRAREDIGPAWDELEGQRLARIKQLEKR